jgi:hypothetical protein
VCVCVLLKAITTDHVNNEYEYKAPCCAENSRQLSHITETDMSDFFDIVNTVHHTLKVHQS